MSERFVIEKLGRKSIAGDELWTVVLYVDDVPKGGDHHWVRERFARRAAELYRKNPALHGATESVLRAHGVLFDSDAEYASEAVECTCSSSAAWASCLAALDWRITVRILSEDADGWQSSGEDLPPFTISGKVATLALSDAVHLVGTPQERGWLAATLTAYNAETGHIIERKLESPGVRRIL